MKLDNLKKPISLWHEDINGNKYDIHFSNNPPEPLPDKMFQHSLNVIVKHNICQKYAEPKWPARLLKWLLNKIPESWRGHNSHVMEFETTIGCGFSFVKYFVENRDFTFHDACVLYAELCGRCVNICEWEINGEDLNNHKQELDKINTHCNNCKDIDPEYHNKYQMKYIYRAFKRDGDVKKEFEYLFRDEINEQKTNY